MRKLTFSIAIATLATAGVAVAAPAIAPKGDVTRAQAQATAAEHFAKMDANGDGKLDTADRAARQAKVFDRIDADGNGAISREEFAAMHGQGGERGQRMGGEHKRGHRAMRGGFGGRMGLAKAADANNDGAISQAEFTAGALKMFDALDTDKNGTVTQAERQASREAMKAKWQQRRAAQTPAN
jgi:Ca2+-binding EF-hand superfamily protein